MEKIRSIFLSVKYKGGGGGDDKFARNLGNIHTSVEKNANEKCAFVRKENGALKD